MSKLLIRMAGAAAIVLSSLAATLPAGAQEFTFRMTHHLPPQAIGHKLFLQPWADKVAEDSKGRIKIEIFPALQLGGTAADVYSQVRDGVVDLGWTLPGYSAGLFPKTELFELPFIAGPATATAPALMEFSEKYLQDEWKDVKLLALHITAPGHVHTVSTPIRTLDDIKGVKVRAPSSVGVKTLEALGAVPVGMPVPQVYEALSRKVVEGALLPWTIMKPTRIYEVTKFSTEAGILASTFAFFMNKDAYNSLPDDLKKVIDDNSGIPLAKKAGVLWQDDEKPARKKAAETGTEIIELDEAQIARWKEATQPVIDAWVKAMDAKGENGQQMVDDARALIVKYSQTN
jgi:TRAP-type C4-dicarboxylate transport system substrate-binding protein